MIDLQQQRVLVVGGSSGIGEGVAKACVDAGAVVTIASRSQEKLDAAANRIGGGVRTLTVDTLNEDSVEGLFARLGEVEHVVMSAAEIAVAPEALPRVVDAQALMNSKFWGAYRIARAAHIAANGSLTLISGASSVRPSKGRVLQTAVNAAMEALARSLALELAPVRVNAVSPGMVETPLLAGAAPAFRAQLLERARQLPTGRLGQPADIALQVLACMANPFMTGSIIYLEGGVLL